MQELMGHTIRHIYVNGDQHILVFDTDNGKLSYETTADCCSETWFADIIGVPYLLSATVQAVSRSVLPEVNDGRTRQEVDEFYGVSLDTSKGHVDIVFRNSSNGYYGGNIELCTKGYTNLRLTEILADWGA